MIQRISKDTVRVTILQGTEQQTDGTGFDIA